MPGNSGETNDLRAASALFKPGVQPYWTGEHAKEDAIGYATARAKFGLGEIRVLNHDGNVQAIIPLTKVRKP